MLEEHLTHTKWLKLLATVTVIATPPLFFIIPRATFLDCFRHLGICLDNDMEMSQVLRLWKFKPTSPHLKNTHIRQLARQSALQIALILIETIQMLTLPCHTKLFHISRAQIIHDLGIRAVTSSLQPYS